MQRRERYKKEAQNTESQAEPKNSNNKKEGKKKRKRRENETKDSYIKNHSKRKSENSVEALLNAHVEKKRVS